MAEVVFTRDGFTFFALALSGVLGRFVNFLSVLGKVLLSPPVGSESPLPLSSFVRVHVIHFFLGAPLGLCLPFLQEFRSPFHPCPRSCVVVHCRFVFSFGWKSREIFFFSPRSLNDSGFFSGLLPCRSFPGCGVFSRTKRVFPLLLT